MKSLVGNTILLGISVLLILGLCCDDIACGTDLMPIQGVLAVVTEADALLILWIKVIEHLILTNNVRPKHLAVLSNRSH